MKNIHVLIQEAQQTPCRMNLKLCTNKQNTIKLLKSENRENLESNKRKTTQNTRNPQILIALFSVETIEASRLWYYIFKMVKEKNL